MLVTQEVACAGAPVGLPLRVVVCDVVVSVEGRAPAGGGARDLCPMGPGGVQQGRLVQVQGLADRSAQMGGGFAPLEANRGEGSKEKSKYKKG